MENIAVVCNYQLNPDRIAGMDRFFRTYDEKLRELGKNVTWFFSGGKNFNFYSGMNVHLSNEEIIEDFFISHLKYQHQYDVVVTHFIALCTPFFQKLKKKQNPYIIAVDHNPRPLEGFSLEKKIRKKIAGKLYSRFIDCFVGVSQYTVDCILRDYGRNIKGKTKLIYNGIDTSIYIKRKNRNSGKFIVASHLRESKGIQDLIEAVKILPRHTQDLISIDVFGEGPFQNCLKSKVEEYELESQIKFKGSSSDLPILFQNYSFMLQPTYMECFSLSILESLAANVPVVTTTVGGNMEVIADGVNGFIFPPKKIETLATIIKNIITGIQAVDKDVNALVEENYTLEQMVTDHLNLLPKIKFKPDEL